jgi:hypothetical protein
MQAWFYLNDLFLFLPAQTMKRQKVALSHFLKCLNTFTQNT